MKKIGILLIIFLIFPTVAFAQYWQLTNYGSQPTGTLYSIIRNILNWLLTALGMIGIIGFAISGIMYLISSGDDDMISKAKKGMQYSIVGVIVGLSGFVIIQAVDAILNARTNF